MRTAASAPLTRATDASTKLKTASSDPSLDLTSAEAAKITTNASVQQALFESLSEREQAAAVTAAAMEQSVTPPNKPSMRIPSSPRTAAGTRNVEHTPTQVKSMSPPPAASSPSEGGSPRATAMFIDHFSAKMQEARLDKTALHPLAPWRVRWRWFGSLLLLLYGLSLMKASWLVYRCDADDLCDFNNAFSSPIVEKHVLADERKELLEKGVRIYSTAEILYALTAPKPVTAASGTAAALADLAPARILHEFHLLAVPIDVLLSIPWFDAFPVLYPQAVRLYNRIYTYIRPPPPPPEPSRPHPLIQKIIATPIVTAIHPFITLSRNTMRSFKHSAVGRFFAAIERLKKLPPPPRLLQPLLDEYVVPVLYARNFGSGMEGAFRLIHALPAIGDALWELQVCVAACMCMSLCAF